MCVCVRRDVNLRNIKAILSIDFFFNNFVALSIQKIDIYSNNIYSPMP